MLAPRLRELRRAPGPQARAPRAVSGLYGPAAASAAHEDTLMGLVLLVLLILLLVGGLPTWGYHQYGYAPTGAVGTVLIVVLILILLGRL
jgi:hypothetical protein